MTTRRARRAQAMGAAMTLACGLGVASPVLAHPHVFIDTGVEAIFDDEGQLAALQVVWVYDEFYSMMAIDDYGLDPEFTGELTEDERVELAEIYSNWVEGYDGDLYALHAGERVDLSGPLEVEADLNDGRITISLVRALEERLDPGVEPVTLRVYDPSYFTLYTIAREPTIRGRDDCSAEARGPDLEAAEARLQEELDQMTEQGLDSWEIEQDFPAVGAEFAEEIRLTCAASS